MLPDYVGDLQVYQGDDYTVTVTFADGSGSPINVSGSTFTARIIGANGGIQAGALAWTVDMTHAATGSVGLTLAGTALAAVTGPTAEPVWFLRWDLAETGLWNRTILEGRVALRTQP